MLAAFPKSGSTWLTFMLAQLLWNAGQEQTFLDNRFLPEIGRHNGAEKRLSTGGRLIRTHERYRPSYKRAIYVVRDGRDVAVSLYYHLKRAVGMEAEFDEYLNFFLDGWLTGAGPWNGHVIEWLDSPAYSTGDVLLVRYEDMKANASRELKRASEFLSVEASDALIDEAVKAGSLDAMKGREQATKGIAHREEGEKISVVRKGKSGDWRNHFSDADQAKFARLAGDAMSRLGYSLDPSP